MRLKKINKLHKFIVNILGYLYIDWVVTSLAILLSIGGIMTIYSATRTPLGENQPEFYLKQIVWLFIGLTLMFILSIIGYRRLQKLSSGIYVFAFALLVLTLLLGHTGMGAKRWLRIGPVNFQPSEILRLATIITLASFFSRTTGPLRGKHILAVFFLFIFLPALIYYYQPDLGSSILLALVVITMILIKGIQKRLMFAITALTVLVALSLGPMAWNHLKPYQKNRIIAFIEPEADPTGIGYQIIQSKVTIGSGKWFGKGYLKGTQGPLRFLPERHTDFVFSVFAEEWGFMGSVILLIAYIMLIIRGFETAYYAKDSFGFYIASGISTMFLIYFTINLGMTMGLLPVVGIPLPFFSYGGTALVVNYMAIGLLNSVRGSRGHLLYS